MWPWRQPKATVTDEGLLVRSMLVPWDHVYHFEWTRQGGLVATEIGWAAVSRPDTELVERHLTPWEAERDAAVAALPAAERAAWLGPGGARKLRQRNGWKLLGVYGGTAAMAVGAVLMFLLRAYDVGSLCLLVGACATVIGLSQLGPPVRLYSDGILVGGSQRRHLRWSDLRGAIAVPVPGGKPGDQATALITRYGPVTLPPDYAQSGELLEAVSRCMAFRRGVVPAPEPDRLFSGRYRFGRHGLLLDDEGLHRIPRQPGGSVPWDELTPPEWGRFGPTLRAGGRRYRLGLYAGGTPLARRIEQRLRGEESLLDEEGALRGEVIERWLGVPPAGSLVCGKRDAVVVVGACVLLVLVVMWLRGVSGGAPFSDVLMGVLPQLIMLLGGMVLVGARSVQAVTADARGLSVRGRRGRHRTYAWAEIRSLQPGSSGGWTIQTDRGDLVISSAHRHSGRVIGVISRLLAERAVGNALPADAPLPATALSRMRGEEPDSAARGLSRAADDTTCS